MHFVNKRGRYRQSINREGERKKVRDDTLACPPTFSLTNYDPIVSFVYILARLSAAIY